MGLYLVERYDIHNRQVDGVFSFNEHKCVLIKHDKIETLFVFVNRSLDSYKKIIEYAEKNRFNSFEIEITDYEYFEELLSYLSTYLLDKDLSIGILSIGSHFIDDNRDMIKRYGVTMANKPIMMMNCLKLEKDFNKPVFNKTSNKVLRKPRHIVLEESFHDRLLKLLIESNKDNVEVYKKAGVSRQVFSKIISTKDMIPTKLTIISLCIGLELTLKESKELLLSAGYSLSKSLLLDSIIMKYLSDEIYDLDIINDELYENECPLIGWHPREK